MGICWTVGTKRSWWNGDDYLLALSRYVHLNPVRVGGIEEKPISEQIKRLREYPWGTYLSYIGRRKAFDFVEYAPILAEMSGKRRGRSKRYREFVETGLAKSDDDFKAAMKLSPRSIGSDGFRTWVDKLYQEMIERDGCPEDAAFRRINEPLSADKVLGILAEVFEVPVEEYNHRRRDSVLRGIAGGFLVRYAGLTQREAAAKMGGISGGAVNRQIRKVRVLLENERGLRKLAERAEERMEQLRRTMSKPP